MAVAEGDQGIRAGLHAIGATSFPQRRKRAVPTSGGDWLKESRGDRVQLCIRAATRPASSFDSA